MRDSKGKEHKMKHKRCSQTSELSYWEDDQGLAQIIWDFVESFIRDIQKLGSPGQPGLDDPA